MLVASNHNILAFSVQISDFYTLCNEHSQCVFHRPFRSDDHHDRHPLSLFRAVCDCLVYGRLSSRAGAAAQLLVVLKARKRFGLRRVWSFPLGTLRQWLHAAEGMLILHRQSSGGGRQM